MKHLLQILTAILVLLCCSACISPQIKLFSDSRDALQEFVLQGEGEQKILLIPVEGMISDAADQGLLRSQPSMVQEIVSRLEKAKKDPDIKALLLKIDSPGGTVTASDLIYHEIQKYKEETGVVVVAVLMNLAASGGYYVSLPADLIMAHPTTVTGSVGVIMMRPGVVGLMDKAGVTVDTKVSGVHKDMGSPFRKPTETESTIFQEMITSLANRFVDLVREHRDPSPAALERITTGRIFLADEALELGMVDGIGYLSDAIDGAKKQGNLPSDAQVVVYRRNEYVNDTLYNDAAVSREFDLLGIGSGIGRILPSPKSGFYYLWTPGAE